LWISGENYHYQADVTVTKKRENLLW